MQMTEQTGEVSLSLIEAILRDDTAAAIEALTNGADPNTYFDGLHGRRATSLWQRLRRVFATPTMTQQDEHWQTKMPVLVLEVGAYEGMFQPPPINLTIMKALLDRGADVDRPDSAGRTALMWAFHADNWENGGQEAAKLLLAYGADVNACDSEGNTVLMRAVGAANVEGVQALLARGAEVNVKSKSGLTALLCTEDPAILELLNKAGAEDEGSEGEIITHQVSRTWTRRPDV
jgi:hypothetical protein